MSSRHAATVCINTSAVLWHSSWGPRGTRNQDRLAGCPPAVRWLWLRHSQYNKEITSFSERLIDSKRSARSHNLEDWNLHQHRCGNPKPWVNQCLQKGSYSDRLRSSKWSQLNVEPCTGRRPETRILNNTEDIIICTWIIVMFAKALQLWISYNEILWPYVSTFTAYLLSANTTTMRVHKHDNTLYIHVTVHRNRFLFK
jgi:hypothetical protein